MVPAAGPPTPSSRRSSWTPSATRCWNPWRTRRSSRWAAARLAFTTDTYVVSPLFFPGGDIGDLAVNGTVNDLAVSGARPLHLSAGFVLEEGFPVADLRRIVASMAAAAERAGVQVVTGDTKVVQRGKADSCFVNTAGIGVLERPVHLSVSAARPGDAVIVSGADRGPRDHHHAGAGRAGHRIRPALGHRAAHRAGGAAARRRAVRRASSATRPAVGWRPSATSWPRPRGWR